MPLTEEQKQIGQDNFNEAVASDEVRGETMRDITRRTFLKGAAAGGITLGSLYFGYGQLAQNERVKVGFIGTGDEGGILITEHPEDYMDVVAIADIRPSNRKRALHGDGNEHRIGLINKLGRDKALSIKLFDDHKQLIAAKDELGLEAVVIAVPLNIHAPIAIACMQAGLHVLSEKLMAHSIAECKQMIQAARENNVLLAVGHQRHYSVLYDNANDLVKRGLLGDVRYISAQWHRNNSFPGRDSWRTPEARFPKEDVEALSAESLKRLGYSEDDLADYGFESLEQLINWRLYNETGGGLMAELGSHQLDACSIFLGKVKPIAVQGFGGKTFYGVPGIGSPDKQADDREIDDHVCVLFEFPGKGYYKTDAQGNPVKGSDGKYEVASPDDKVVVSYSSISTNGFEPYGETIHGTRATLIMESEQRALLFKEGGPEGAGGPDQRLWVIRGNQGDGPVLDAYETSQPTAAASNTRAAMGEDISRGYREEMEHFCHRVRVESDYANPAPPSAGGLKCNGTVAMGDAIMAFTANLAMKHKTRIEFHPDWFDPESPATPEEDVKGMLA